MEEENIKALDDANEFFENMMKGNLNLDFEKFIPVLQSQAKDIGKKYTRYAFQIIEFDHILKHSLNSSGK